MIKLLVLALYSIFVTCFQLPALHVSCQASHLTQLAAEKVSPEDGRVLVVGLGALPLLSMKTAFFAGYKEILHILPESQHRKCAKLMFGDGYEMTTDSEGFIVTPITSAPGFGGASCTGKMKFLDGSNNDDVASGEHRQIAKRRAGEKNRLTDRQS